MSEAGAAMLDFSQNHLDLFGLPARFDVDVAALEARYRTLQSAIHPDRHVAAPETQRRLAEQWAGQVNEAYRVLKSPLERGRYLLSLRGIDALAPTQTTLPAEFLMQQMEWREELAEARRGDPAALRRLEQALQREHRDLLSALSCQLDELGHYDLAAETLRKLKFIARLEEEVAEAFEAL